LSFSWADGISQD